MEGKRFLIRYTREWSKKRCPGSGLLHEIQLTFSYPTLNCFHDYLCLDVVNLACMMGYYLDFILTTRVSQADSDYDITLVVDLNKGSTVESQTRANALVSSAKDYTIFLSADLLLT